MVRDELKEWFGLADDMLPVIHNGIDSSTFHPNLRNEFLSATRDKWDIPQEVPLFLFVGSGFERKGLTSCLYALAALKNSDARMLVVGKDRNINSYRKLVQRLGLGPRVTFTGPQSDTRPFYGAADALLLPTLYDPFPNVVLEGMASGLPVITSNKSGSTDIIEQGVNGLYCDALDIDGLTSMMSELLDPTKRMALGNSARITVEPMSLDNMTQQYLDLYSRFFSL